MIFKKSLFYPLLVLYLITAPNSNAHNNKQEKPVSEKKELSIIDFTSTKKSSDGYIYNLNDKYYVATSFESLTVNLKIDMTKDIDHVAAYQPDSEIIKDIKKRIPKKYLNNFKGIIMIYLKEK